MTTTTLSSSQALTAGYGIAPATASSVALQTTSVSYCISIKLINGAARGDQQKPLRVYVCSSAYSSSAPAEELRQEAAVFEVVCNPNPSGTTIQATPLLVRKGDTVYVWYEVPNWAAAGTVNAVCYEIN